jgi:hypothetical protein
VVVVLVYPSINKVSFVFIRNFNVLFTSPLLSITSLATAMIGVLDNLIFITAPDGMRFYSIDPTFTYLSIIPYPISPWRFLYDNKNDLFLYSINNQSYYLINKTNNFSIVFQGTYSYIQSVMIHYPNYIIVNDANRTTYQIDI